MTLLRATTNALAFALIVSACSGPDSANDAVADTTTTTVGGIDAPDSTTTASPTSTTTINPEDLAGIDGLIAFAGLGGLRFADATGGDIAALADEEAFGAQPTWSRDGKLLVATVIGDDGSAHTLVVTEAGDTVLTHPARRPYFFYSWAPTGEYIAALGPGPLGTSLDILSPDGSPLHDISIDTGSFYLAWEPDGNELLVHLDDTLALVRDVAVLDVIDDLGTPGQRFLAPAWVPGTRTALIVDESSGELRLVELEVDTATTRDLGPVASFAGIQVASDGSRALIAHNEAVAPTSDSITTVAFRDTAVIEAEPEPEAVATTEIVDLPSGDRSPVSDDLTLWAEWSPDSSTVALLQSPEGDGALTWMVWFDGYERRFVPFTPTITFFQSYLPFAWQFTESPRIWSPDGDALVYSALTDEGPRALVQRLTDDGPALVAGASIAFWAPN